MKGYCVFWIPSIYHVAPVPLSENTFLEKEDIPEEIKNSQEYLEGYREGLKNKKEGIKKVGR